VLAPTPFFSHFYGSLFIFIPRKQAIGDFLIAKEINAKTDAAPKVLDWQIVHEIKELAAANKIMISNPTEPTVDDRLMVALAVMNKAKKTDETGAIIDFDYKALNQAIRIMLGNAITVSKEEEHLYNDLSTAIIKHKSDPIACLRRIDKMEQGCKIDAFPRLDQPDMFSKKRD